MQAQVCHRGQYNLRIDASNLINPYDPRVARAPELVSIVMQDHVQIPLDNDTHATIGCELPAYMLHLTMQCVSVPGLHASYSTSCRRRSSLSPTAKISLKPSCTNVSTLFADI